ARERPDRIYVRQSFRLSDTPETATLRVGGRGGYTVFVNGVLLLRGSGDVAQNVYVTRYLGKGVNVLAIECENRGGDAAVQFELAIRYRTGRTALVISNGDERATRVRSPGWERLAFDDRTWPPSALSDERRTTNDQRPPARPGATLNPQRSTLNPLFDY